MKRLIIKSVLVGIISTVAVCVFSGCKKDKEPAVQESDFELSHLPVPRELLKGDVAEIRCKITPTGDAITKYSLCYMQSSGKGVLKLEDGTTLKERESYPLSAKEFKLFYTSDCKEAQTIEVTVVDDFNHSHKMVFSFSNREFEDFEIEHSPVPTELLKGDTAEIEFKVSPKGEEETQYSFRYVQPSGKGILKFEDGSILKENESYPIDKIFKVYYTSDCEVDQKLDVFIEDPYDHSHKVSFSIANREFPDFDLEHSPVPEGLMIGESIEVWCKILPKGEGKTKYFLRYEQPTGKGVLKLEDGTIVNQGERYLIDKSSFKIQYTSNCEVEQKVNIYVEDEHNHSHKMAFVFANRIPDFDVECSNDPENAVYKLDTIEIKCKILSDVGIREAGYSLCWRNTWGYGDLRMGDVLIKPRHNADPKGDVIVLPSKEFTLYYIPRIFANVPLRGNNCSVFNIYLFDKAGHVKDLEYVLHEGVVSKSLDIKCDRYDYGCYERLGTNITFEIISPLPAHKYTIRLDSDNHKGKLSLGPESIVLDSSKGITLKDKKVTLGYMSVSGIYNESISVWIENSAYPDRQKKKLTFNISTQQLPDIFPPDDGGIVIDKPVIDDIGGALKPNLP